MILQRIGNKAKLAKKIFAYYPQGIKVYKEWFFGGGGMFFNIPNFTPYVFLNDIDNDVFNLFQQVQFNRKELYETIENLPYHNSVFQWLRKLESKTNPLTAEKAELWQAVRFVILSNYSFLGKSDTLKFSATNSKRILLNNIEKTFERLCKGTIKFHNADFEKFHKSVATKSGEYNERTFNYLDPPYLGTTDNYSDSFTEADSFRLFEVACGSGQKFAYSEFDHPFILDQAKSRGLNVHIIVERRTLNSRNTEILVTNYDSYQKLF